MVGSELRTGKQHCQKGTPEFIRETMGVVVEACGYERKKLFRFDTEYCERGGKTGKGRRIYKAENQRPMPVVGSF